MRKKILSLVLVGMLGVGFIRPVSACEANNVTGEKEYSVAVMDDSEYSVSLDKFAENYETVEYTADELIEKNMVSESELEDGEVLIGGAEAIEKSSAVSTNSVMKAKYIAGIVHYTSYATYTKDKGVNVYVKLYAPWYYFTNPKFTYMSGTASVKTKNHSVAKAFYKKAKSTSTISTTVKTGLKDKAKTKGKVVVSGAALGENIVAGGGAFYITYSITIPK